MVSRAFQILSDADKKSRYDQFGGDPDNRFSSSGAGAAGASPFSGFARSPGRGPMYEDEISPEELFNRFFGGGMGPGFQFGESSHLFETCISILTAQGGGGFGGPQFVFNMGGGPGFTVHPMGGNRPRARPRDASEPAPSGLSALTQLLPLLLLFVLPLLSSFFTGSTNSGPQFRYDSPVPPHTMHRVTPRYKIDYYMNPTEVDGYTSRQFNALDQRAEVDYISTLKFQCENEVQRLRQEINEATGFFFIDENRIQRARNAPMVGCRRLDDLKVSRQY